MLKTVLQSLSAVSMFAGAVVIAAKYIDMLKDHDDAFTAGAILFSGGLIAGGLSLFENIKESK